METRANYIVVGSFVLAILVGLVASVVWLADVDVDRKVQAYDIFFEGSVTGLQVGNTVRYSGVPVGVVTDIGINKDNVEQVRVTIEVPDDTPIKEDTVASLEYQGLTGVGYVDLRGGTNEAPLLRKTAGQEHPVIASRPSQLQAVFDQAPELINRFIALVDRANMILRPENQQNVTNALANVNEFTGALKDSSTDLQSVLAEASSTMVALRNASAEAEKIMKSFAGRSDRIAQDVEATIGEGRALIADAQVMTQDISKAAKAAEPTLKTADATLQEFGGLAAELKPEVGPTARSARATMAELKQVTGELRKAANSFRTAADSVASAAGEAEGIISDNRDSVSHFAGSGLMEFTQLMGEMRTLVGSLNRITAEIERDPARFFFGDTQKGFEAE
ncbi:MCE family protein [Aestuariispira ectoiniformans]|uniref:MCE family protein n=1 Tax=Aestuariispira ectoiniformans TaxID=2775080 RepID=UPI00223B8F19|nr:MlaD family protein [Aestuariispira ectoiniformans]